MEKQSIPETKVVLGYATPDADGLPEFVPPAEALISSGKGPKSLRGLFGKTELAVDYYCKSLKRRYDETTLSLSCACGNEQATHVIQLSWFVSAPLRTGEFQLSSNEAYSTCTTLHAVGAACLRDWEHRIGRFSRLARLASIWSLGLIILLIIGHTLERLSGSRTHYLGIAWVAALVGMLFIKPIFRRIVVRGFPVEVKSIARKGVALQGISCVFTRIDGKLCVME